MMENLNKGPGLQARIQSAGMCLRRVNGVIDISPELQAVIDAYTLADARDWRKAEISEHAKTLRDRAIAAVSAGEMASWAIKLSEVARYNASGDSADAPMLSAEADARGVSLQVLCAKVDSKAVEFSTLEALIAGCDGRHRDALENCESFADVTAYDYSAGWPAV